MASCRAEVGVRTPVNAACSPTGECRTGVFMDTGPWIPWAFGTLALRLDRPKISIDTAGRSNSNSQAHGIGPSQDWRRRSAPRTPRRRAVRRAWRS
eukprot:5643978-Prymnesium_polylepis.1